MKKMFAACIIASFIFAQNVASIELTDNGIRNISFSFNDKQYIQTRIEGLDNIARNAIKINNNMIYFGTPRGFFSCLIIQQK